MRPVVCDSAKITKKIEPQRHRERRENPILGSKCGVAVSERYKGLRGTDTVVTPSLGFRSSLRSLRLCG
jgi:hypothetical protein